MVPPRFPLDTTFRRLAWVALIASRFAAVASGRCVGPVCPLAPADVAPAAVVRIVHERGTTRYFGSGALVESDPRRGLVLTCAHLFRAGVGEVTVVFRDGHRFGARVLAVDGDHDLAALEIAPSGILPIPIAEEPPQRGEPLTSCGYGPHGRYRCNRGRMLGYVRAEGTRPGETLELSGSARLGDSGGPIFNGRGQLAAVLWGTDGRIVGGTPCGPIRAFLRSIVDSPPPADAAPLPTPHGADADDPLGALRGRIDRVENAVGRTRVVLEKLSGGLLRLENAVGRTEAATTKEALRAVAREAAVGGLAERAPGAIEALLPGLLAALGWTGPPALAAVLLARFGAGVLRRRVARRGAAAASAARSKKPTSLNDDYASQLAGVYALSGRSTMADVTLGREYDEALREAETSSDGTLAAWAKRLRRRVAQRFYRIHGEAPAPGDPVETPR